MRKSERNEREKKEKKKGETEGEEEMVFQLGQYMERGRQVRKRGVGGLRGETKGKGRPAFSSAYSIFCSPASKCGFPAVSLLFRTDF